MTLINPFTRPFSAEVYQSVTTRLTGARLRISCPFCMQMFEDAQSALAAGNDAKKSLRVADIAELVSEALEN